MRWWERDPARYLAELSAIERRHPRLRLVDGPGGARGLYGPVCVGDTDRFVRLWWPETWPHQPPALTEVAPFGDDAVDLRHTGHQLIGGELCLYTHDASADGWSPERLAADVLDRYVAFRLAQPEASDPDRPLGLPLRTEFRIPASLTPLLKAPGGWGFATLSPSASGDSGVFMRTSCERPALGQLTWDAAQPWHRALTPRGQIAVVWVGVELSDAPWGALARDWDGLVEALRARLPEHALAQIQQDPWVLLSRLEGDAVDLRMVLRPQSGLPFGSAPVRLEDPRELVFHRVDGALPGRALLKDATAVMVGLGSLGAEIALALAKAGVGRFLLFDPERLAPENVCRHIGGLGHVGTPKVEVVAGHIAQHNPDAVVERHARGLFWDLSQVSPEAGRAFAAALEDPRALVVVSAAEHGLERAVNDLCVRAGRPAIYASALGAVEHGRMFRVLPNESPCYACVLLAQARDPARFPSFQPALAGDDAPLAAYRQPGIPGLGIDVSQIALFAARLALQTFGRLFPGLGVPDQEGHHLLWSRAGGWGFDHPLQLRIEPYTCQPDCPVCAVPRGAADGSRSVLVELEARLRDPLRMAPQVPLVGIDRPRS